MPPGVYQAAGLVMRPRVRLCGERNWSFRQSGCTVLRLARGDAPCLIDVSEASGAVLAGLSLEGAGLGDGVHGVRLVQEGFAEGGREDTLLIVDLGGHGEQVYLQNNTTGQVCDRDFTAGHFVPQW